MADSLTEENCQFIEENDTEKDEVDSEPVGNPAPPPDVDMDLLRGDRIGDTVYSGKWCIQTVMKLFQSNVIAKTDDEEEKAEIVDMDEDLQNEVGVLWDMTINVEVCQYLKSVEAIESIYHVIENSKCPRASEMCVGMLANIISHEELWQSLHSDETLFAILIPLLSHTDQPLLLELSRFFNTALNHQEYSCCYESVWENRQIVCQELLRILSGSTNSDLLRQTSELTHILMCLDQNDTRFNAMFADVDFITSVLEASKEFGYKQASQGQVRVMEILHCFTTYDAGIAAIEPCMEEMTRACVKYLKMLCHNLNLSSSCDMLAIILKILSHIFSRCLAVRIELMSSSSLVHCMLKMLASVYRRLGMYNSITLSPRRNSIKGHALKKSSSSSSEDQLSRKLAAVSSPSSWENLPAEDYKTNRPPSASWSERAGVAGESSGRQAFRTPDVSPLQNPQLKELELSWSERRVASPQTKKSSFESENEWKRPAARKKKMKRARQRKEEEKHDEEVKKKDESRSDKNDIDKVTECDVNAHLDDERTAAAGKADEEEENNYVGMFGRNSLPQNQDDEHICGSVDRRVCSTDSNTSSGFEPSQDTPFIADNDANSANEAMDFAEGNADTSDAHTAKETSTVEAEESCRNRDKSDFLLSVKVEGTGDSLENTNQQNMENHADIEQRPNSANEGTVTKTEHSANECAVTGIVKNENHSYDHEDEDSKDSSSVSVDRYHNLLQVLSEFLADFFNNIRERLMTEQGAPALAETVTFLNTQCSSTYIRALGRCLSPHENVSQPLSHLLRLAKHLKAFHLRNILLELFPGVDLDQLHD